MDKVAEIQDRRMIERVRVLEGRPDTQASVANRRKLVELEDELVADAELAAFHAATVTQSLKVDAMSRPNSWGA